MMIEILIFDEMLLHSYITPFVFSIKLCKGLMPSVN